MNLHVCEKRTKFHQNSRGLAATGAPGLRLLVWLHGASDLSQMIDSNQEPYVNASNPCDPTARIAHHPRLSLIVRYFFSMK